MNRELEVYIKDTQGSVLLYQGSMLHDTVTIRIPESNIVL